MNTTLKPCLLKRRQKPNGEIPVYIRITQNRKYSLLSTGISIEKKYWDDRNKWRKWIKSKHHSSKAYNKKISEIITKLNRLIESTGENISRKQIVQLFQGNGRDTIYQYGEAYAEELQEQGFYHPHKQAKAAVSKFKEFAGDVRFNEVTPQVLNDFQHWMATEKENHPNTVVKTIGRLKAIFTHAYENDITTNMPFNDPKFKRFKKSETNKQALSIEQIEAIEKLDLEHGSDLWHARNYFMFSFWNAGIRFTDLAFLKWENVRDGRLFYQMGKNDKVKDIQLLPEANEILDYYRDESKACSDFIFPILPKQEMTLIGYRKKAASANATINLRLKDIQNKAGIQTRISTHIARHSFARWAQANKMDLDFIGKALAHSKRTTTEGYLNSLTEYNIDEQMIKLAERRKGEK